MLWAAKKVWTLRQGCKLVCGPILGLALREDEAHADVVVKVVNCQMTQIWQSCKDGVIILLVVEAAERLDRQGVRSN